MQNKKITYVPFDLQKHVLTKTSVGAGWVLFRISIALLLSHYTLKPLSLVVYTYSNKVLVGVEALKPNTHAVRVSALNETTGKFK